MTFPSAAELRRALEREEILLLYHPQVDMASGRPVGVEACIRWRHPDLGLLHATRFVDAVPPAGLAREYMRWIARTACAQLARWRAGGADLGHVAINAWPVSIGPELVEDLLEATRTAGIAPSSIQVETQPEATYDAATFAALAAFRSAGLRIALDDFGDGDLRLAALREAPFDVVKLPVSFVLHAGTAFDDAMIAAGVAFARAIGAGTVAEGVETLAIRDRVRALGCAIGQGYLWSRIVPGDEIPRALAAVRVDGTALP